MSYKRNYYREEITTYMDGSNMDAVNFVADYLRNHGGQYRCDVTRKHQRNNLGIEWDERIYTFSFFLYPHEYENMMREL